MQRWIYLSLSSFLLVGCMTQQPIYYRPLPKTKPATQKPVVKPEKPTKVHGLKEVQDNNFNPDYMYPETPKRTRSKTKLDTPPVTVTASMGREECIAMIGQEKFDKYTQMLGSENAAIKRCVMMKSMK